MAYSSLEKVLQILRQNVSKIEGSTGLTGHIDLIYGALDQVQKELNAHDTPAATNGGEQVGAAIEAAQLAKKELKSYIETVRQWERLVGLGGAAIHAAELDSPSETTGFDIDNGEMGAEGVDDVLVDKNNTGTLVELEISDDDGGVYRHPSNSEGAADPSVSDTRIDVQTINTDVLAHEYAEKNTSSNGRDGDSARDNRSDPAGDNTSGERGDSSACHGNAGARSEGSGKGDGSDGTSSKTPEEHVAERIEQGNNDAFNQEHRPEVVQKVEVGADSGLMPKATAPFGRGVELEPNTHYHVENRGDYYTDRNGNIRHVEAHSAVERRDWFGMREATNPDLRDPLPNATYTVDGRFHYTTDDWGRTVRMEIDRMDVAPKGERLRNDRLQAKIGHLGGKGYDGGHLGGHQFGGAPEEINMVAMLKDVNRGHNGNYHSSFRKFENEVAANPDGYRNIVIEIEYDAPGVLRGAPLSSLSASKGTALNLDRVPTGFTVSYTDAAGATKVREFYGQDARTLWVTFLLSQVKGE